MKSPEQALFNQALIAGYDPLEHLLEGTASLAEIPHLPEFLLRWYRDLPDNTSFERYDELPKSTEDPAVVRSEVVEDDALTDYFNRYQEELATLEDCGVNIPHPGTDLFSIIREADVLAIDGLAIFTLVRRYEVQSLEANDPRGLDQIEGCLNYLTRKLQRPGWFLSDIYTAEQHGIIREMGGGNVVKLLDVEPIMAYPLEQLVNYSSREEKLLESRIKDLDWWSEQIANAQ